MREGDVDVVHAKRMLVERALEVDNQAVVCLALGLVISEVEG